MALTTQAWGHDGKTYDGKDMRQLIESIFHDQPGVVYGLATTQQGSPGSTVQVSAGNAIVSATGSGLTGLYNVWNDAALTSPTINPTTTNGRKDRLILRVTSGVPALEVVEGTASGSPAEPAITGDNYLELALITLPGSTTNITNAMIADRRVFAAAQGGVFRSTSPPAIGKSTGIVYDATAGLWKVTEDSGATWKPSLHHMPHASSVNTALTAGTTSSATYVDIPGTSVTMSFTKYRADTNLVVSGYLNNVYNTNVSFPTTTLGVSVGGTDYDLCPCNIAASNRMNLAGVTNPISGISAGTVTVKLRIKCGGGVFTTATDGRGGIQVVETF